MPSSCGQITARSGAASNLTEDNYLKTEDKTTVNGDAKESVACGQLHSLVNWFFNPTILWCYGFKRWKQPKKCANKVMWEDRSCCGKFFTEEDAIGLAEKRTS
jgi:hypothetical protein